MGKELSEMTLAELWELFPIFLVQHDDKWKNYYKEIEASIMDLLKGLVTLEVQRYRAYGRRTLLM